VLPDQKRQTAVNDGEQKRTRMAATNYFTGGGQALLSSPIVRGQSRPGGGGGTLGGVCNAQPEDVDACHAQTTKSPEPFLGGWSLGNESGC